MDKDLEAQSVSGDENEKNTQSEEDKEDNNIKENLETNNSEFFPKPVEKKIPPVPNEVGYGPNKFNYFFCNNIDMKEWKILPDVTPSEIVESRLIKSYLTGDPGSLIKCSKLNLEIQLLRAQIARISAATQISPVGYYISGDNQSDEESDADRNSTSDKSNLIEKLSCTENIDFEEIPLTELSDPSLNNWCHHISYILPQGRSIWWNPATAKLNAEDNENNENSEDEKADSEEEDDDDLFGSKNVKIEPEVGPPLLSSLAEDLPINGCPAWSVKLFCEDFNQRSRSGIVQLKSQLWPGSCCIARAGGKWFTNIYIGWGIKFQGGDNFTPISLGNIMLEFPSSKEIRELDDPTVSEEAIFIAQNSKQKSDGEEDSNSQERNENDESEKDGDED
ncbi:MAG: Radial spoke head protein 4 A [Paramarteilia canceri]